MADGFRVKSVALEGFKGFTTRQEIDIKSRHVFLLGRNGNGKTSIVEAIRWGLFGSLNRQREVVANSDYKGRCRIEIILTCDGEQWNLRRTLIRGVSGGSDAVLTDESGDEHPIGKIMPQLDSVDAGEGAHIIFASQSEPLRRRPTDISAFERTILNHINLLRPKSLLSHLDRFLLEQDALEAEAGEKITTTRSRIDDDIRQLDLRRRRLLSSPPWDSDLAPTVSQSENKARDLIQEISGSRPDESLDGVSLDALIGSAEYFLEESRSQTQSELMREYTAISNRRKKLEALRNNLNSVEEQKAKIENIKSQINSELGGASIEGLHEKVYETREALSTVHLKHRIVDASISLLAREQADVALCPVCNNECQRHALQSALQQNADELSKSETSNLLNRLEDTLKAATSLNNQLQTRADELHQMERLADSTRAFIHAEDMEELAEHETPDFLDEMIAQRLGREASINKQIEDNQAWLGALESRLSKLRDEEFYHQLQKVGVNLRKTKNQFAEVEKAYGNLVSFGESVRRIQKTIKACYSDTLKEEIPEVSLNLSQVFTELTRHPYFDKLVISEDTLPNLVLRVASSQESSGATYPMDVLNGQAESALKLVPYFAFSQPDNTATEMYLVMLDDPTQAFDEEHTETLIERLANLGQHVQLMVASQETSRFREYLPRYFETDAYAVIEPTNWSPQDGPTLNIEYQ